jgi:hypothetical protein
MEVPSPPLTLGVAAYSVVTPSSSLVVWHGSCLSIEENRAGATGDKPLRMAGGSEPQ